MLDIAFLLRRVYNKLKNVEEKEVFRRLLKIIVDNQIYINEDELAEVIERDRKFNRIINEMEEEK